MATVTSRSRGRSGNGAGSVVFDKAKGLYYGYASLDGERRKTRGARTEEEAQGLLITLLYEGQHGLLVKASAEHTVAELGQAWLEQIVKRNCELATFQSYESNWRVHIAPTFGKTKLTKLSRQDIQQWANAKLDAGRSPATVRRMVSTLANALGIAVDWGWLLANPASRIKIKKANSGMDTINALGEADIDQLLLAAEGRSHEQLFTVGIWTGMRRGELGGLRWQDIDFARGRLSIRQTLVWRAGHPWYFKAGAKTRAGRRSFALIPVVAEALVAQARRVEQLRENAAEMWTEYDLVFPSEIGTPLHPGNINNEQIKIEKLAGVEHARIHDWRHTAATKMRAAGVDDRVIMEVCGWKDRAMLDRYQHVHDEHLDEVVERMVARYPRAAGTGIIRLPTRSKFAGRPHSRQKGARLEAAQ